MPWDEPFVGRAAELAALTGELDGVRQGQPAVVLLGGEAGIGKTSLIHRFLAETRGTVLRAVGDPAEVALPFGVVGQLVADVPARLRGPLLAAEPSAEADPLAVGAELLAAIGDLEGAPAPVLVVVDDAPWVDDASARALAFAVRRLRRDHVLVLLGVREPAAPETAWWDRGLGQLRPARRIVLRGLGADELVELGAAAGHALTTAAAERLREHTGGHPMHAAALLRELPSDALLDIATPLPAPRSLATLVLVRVAALSPPARELVLTAGVLGTRCPLRHALAIADPADPVAALDEAVRAGLLVEVGTAGRRDIAFSHQLVRAAVYADLPPARRHELHLAAAETVGGAAATAHRIAAAVGPDPELAAELAAQGRRDLASGRWRSAADLLVSAAELSTSRDDRAERLVAGVDAMLAAGDLARGLRSEPEVRALPAGPARSRVLGRLEVSTGRLRDARVSLSEALDAAGEDGAGRAAAAAHLALLSLVEGDPDAAVELAGRALDWKPSAEDEPTARFVAVVAQVVQGRAADAERVLDRAPGASTETDDILRGVLALWRDDSAAAADLLATVARDGATAMSMQGRVLLLAHLAEAEYRVGDWDGAAGHGALAVSLARDAGVVVGSGLTSALTSYVASGRGMWDVAQARVDAATGATAVLPWWGGFAYAATAGAVLAQARGDPAGMRRSLAPLAGGDSRVRGLVDRAGLLPWRALLVEALLGTGELAAADAELHALQNRCVGRSGWSALEAARLRAELTELRAGATAARELFEQAMELAGRARAELPRARLETAFGQHLVAAGARRPGVDLLRSAHERLARLDAAPFAERSDKQLRAAGLHPPAAGDPLGLTPQELAVARLVAAGRTNQEVGALLYVTGRTVAFHLSNIYAKLGISSRRQLAAHLS